MVYYFPNNLLVLLKYIQIKKVKFAFSGQTTLVKEIVVPNQPKTKVKE